MSDGDVKSCVTTTCPVGMRRSAGRLLLPGKRARSSLTGARHAEAAFSKRQI